MRLSSTLTWAALAHLAWSSSDEALICISEKAQETTGRPPVISPEIARLVLGRRLDLSRYQTLGDIDGQVLDILNDLPGKRLQLFLDEQPNTFPRVLTVVEDVKDTEDLIQSINHHPLLKVSEPPVQSENKRLVQSIIQQDWHRREDGKQRPCQVAAASAHSAGHQQALINAARNRDGSCGDASSFLNPKLNAQNDDWTLVEHVTHLSDLKSSNEYDSALSALKARLYHITTIPTLESTVIILPATQSHTKRSVSTWGSPALFPRRPPTEEPLAPQSSAPENPIASSSQELNTATFPSSGPLPSCFPSRKSLIDSTNNCSSHGTPDSKYNDTTSRDCYHCVCQPTILTNDEGKNKTFRWAGPACSKKDVSESFWLLAFVTVGLLGAAGWGIGLLAGMGSEELPGVLSAGVGGPRAQK